MDRIAWRATVHRVTKSRTQQSTHSHTIYSWLDAGSVYFNIFIISIIILKNIREKRELIVYEVVMNLMKNPVYGPDRDNETRGIIRDKVLLHVIPTFEY